MASPKFRLSIGSQFIRYTDDINPSRPTHIRYGLTFDAPNPIADFRVVDRKLREENTGLFVSGVSWSQPGEQFNAVLVPGTHSYNRAIMEMIDGEESGTVRLRNLVDVGISRIYYLGGGQAGDTCCCPVSGLVKQVWRDGDGTVGNFLAWCTHFDFTLHANSSSDRSAIRAALGPMECQTDQDCYDQYNTFAISCERNQCVHPEQVDCEWSWTPWSPEPCGPDDIQTRTWFYIQPPLDGGLCDAPADPDIVEERHCPSFFDQPGGGGENGNGNGNGSGPGSDQTTSWIRENWLTLVAIAVATLAIILILARR